MYLYIYTSHSFTHSCLHVFYRRFLFGNFKITVVQPLKKVSEGSSKKTYINTFILLLMRASILFLMVGPLRPYPLHPRSL